MNMSWLKHKESNDTFTKELDHKNMLFYWSWTYFIEHIKHKTLNISLLEYNQLFIINVHLEEN